MGDQTAEGSCEAATQKHHASGTTKTERGRGCAMLGEGVAVVFFYVAATLVFLWPLVQDPIDRVYVPDGALSIADRNLILWILAWDWHALTSEPLALFDANSFHPALRTLAGNEHMLGVVPLSGPAYAVSGNPLFAHTTAFVLCLSLSGAAMYALLRHWGVVRTGALFGGFVYALYPHRTHGGAALQLLSGQYLPLALIFLDGTLRSAHLRSAMAFATFLLWHTMCSVYLGFMAVVGLATYGIVVLSSGWRELRAWGVGLAICAAVGTAVVLLAVHTPYITLRSTGQLPDYSDSNLLVQYASGPVKNWLLPPIALREWGYAITRGLPSYLGLLPLAAAASILVWRRRERIRWAAHASLSIALVGYLFALGPFIEVLGHRVTLPYGYLLEWVPGFASMRAPSRFAALTMTGVSALAGIGLGRALKPLEARANGTWLAAVVTGLMLVGTAIEYDLPFDPPRAEEMRVGERIPPVYKELTDLPPGPLLELPFGAPGVHPLDILVSSSYLYYSTFHWRPLLNGYAGYAPPSAHLSKALSRTLPDGRALELLVRTTGVRYVIVHLSSLPPAGRRHWISKPAGLRLIARFGPDLLFEVAERLEPDLLPAMRDLAPTGQTLLGTPIESIPVAERRADLRLTIPPPSHAGPRSIVQIEVEVLNRSGVPWPALAFASPDLIAVDFAWVREGDHLRRPRIWKSPLPGRLPYDLLPGERVRFGFPLTLPGRAGQYTLVLGVRQDREWFRSSFVQVPVSVQQSGDSHPHP